MSRTLLSVQVDNRVRSSQSVAMAARTQAEIIAEGVSAAFLGCGAPPPPDPKAFVWSMAEVLDKCTDAMARADQQLALETADDVGPRAERDAAAKALADELRRDRRLLQDYLGDSALKAYGLAAAVPVAPADLSRYARHAVEALRTMDRPVVVGDLGETSTSRMAGSLEAKVLRLDAALEDLAREGREYAVALTARDRAVTEWAAIYRGTALVLEGLLRLAGRADLADRVRPTERRSRGDEAAPPVVDEQGAPAQPAPAE